MSSELELDGIPSFDVTVTAENLEGDLFEVYKLLFKDIRSKDEVEFEELQVETTSSLHSTDTNLLRSFPHRFITASGISLAFPAGKRAGILTQSTGFSLRRTKANRWSFERLE